MTTIIALSSGLSQPSSTRLLAERMAQSTASALEARGERGVEVEIVEIKDFAHDIMDNLLTGFGSQRLEELKQKVVAADGLIAVTPIFSQSFSGLFKSFLDVLDTKSLINTPVFLGATAGTARHSLALERGAGEFASLISGRLLELVAEIDEFETPDFESLLKQAGIN